MERLYRIGGLALFAFWLVSALCAGAADVCSLTVRVLSPGGKRLVVPVSVEEQNGRVQEKDQNGADVQFCDLGILPVTVKVGSDTLCNQVTVKDVPITWERSYLLVVTYDPDSCSRLEYVPMPVPTCPILFRVSDSIGSWIPGASIKISAPASYVLKTDIHGRAYFLAKVEDKLSGTVRAPGYNTTDFTATCAGTQDLQEKSIRLGKP
jgi:hypothetical protein